MMLSKSGMQARRIGHARAPGRKPPRRFRAWALRLISSATLAAGLVSGGAGLAQPLPQNGSAPLRIIAFGDSLSAGYMLPDAAAFPAVLQKALRARGWAATVSNGAVSGDTASGGLARLDWTLGEGADLVILELGANDMLRGIDPAVTRQALDDILARLKARHIKVLLAGMRAAPSLGRDYGARFEAIYPDLAKKYDVPLYPFFLEGMVEDRDQHLADGMHPNARGVETIVAHIVPPVDALLRSVGPKS